MPKQMPKNGTRRSRAKLHGGDLALGAALAEAAGDQDAVHPLEPLDGMGLLEDLAVDPVELHAHAVGDAAMAERLGQRLVAVEQVRVLADHRDAHLALRRADGVDDALPAAQVGQDLHRQVEMAQHLAVHALRRGS